MKRPTSLEVPGLWESDGSLRDMYVLGTSLKDWRAFLEFASQFPRKYLFDGEAKEQPEVEQLFGNQGGSHLLSLTVGTATVNCHFFVEEEIELDLSPKEIEGPSEHNQLLQ